MTVTNFAVIEEATGRIVQTGVCPALDIYMQGGPGTPAIACDPDVAEATHYFDGENFALFPLPSPGPWAVFDRLAGIWTDPRTPARVVDDLAAARVVAVARINAVSAMVRRRYVTDIPGQEALYLMKEAEARAWISATSPDIADYPLIAAEIGITGQDASQVAQVYINLAQIYVTAAAQLETARLGHVAQAEVAVSEAAAEAVADAFAQIITQSGL